MLSSRRVAQFGILSAALVLLSSMTLLIQGRESAHGSTRARAAAPTIAHETRSQIAYEVSATTYGH